jgi:hypothetical protein
MTLSYSAWRRAWTCSAKALRSMSAGALNSGSTWISADYTRSREQIPDVREKRHVAVPTGFDVRSRRNPVEGEDRTHGEPPLHYRFERRRLEGQDAVLAVAAGPLRIDDERYAVRQVSWNSARSSWLLALLPLSTQMG